MKFSSKLFSFLLEFHFIFIPILLALIKNDQLTSIFIFQISLIFVCTLVHFIKTNEILCYFTYQPAEPHIQTVTNSEVVHFNFVTKYRSILQIATCVTILAVDFRLFPRKFCKVEEEGFSLMDFGTGSALFSLALVSRQLREKHYGMVKRIGRAISSCLPLLLIGMLRMVMIKKTDYQVLIYLNIAKYF